MVSSDMYQFSNYLEDSLMKDSSEEFSMVLDDFYMYCNTTSTIKEIVHDCYLNLFDSYLKLEEYENATHLLKIYG